MKEKIIIFGTGAQSKYIMETLTLRGVDIYGVINISKESVKQRKNLYNTKILGGLELLDELKRDKSIRAIVAHSDNKIKEDLVKKLKRFGFRFINAIHPSAVIASTAKIGINVIINSGAIIQPFATVGNGVMIHAGAVVEHDCVIEDYVNLGPGAKLAGWVRVGKGSYVYTNACIVPQIVIGKNSVVGAGAAVISDVPDNTTAVGVPARLKRKDVIRRS